MTSTINIIEELDLAGPTLILNKEDEQRLLESDNEDTTPNAKIESESDLPEIEICLTNLDNTFESDNAECQEIQSVLETDNEDINAQSDSELLTCSWHQKTKPQILQFTKCCKMPLKWKGKA